MSARTSPSSRPRTEAGAVVGSWLVMGDAKDYERVRSRIDDGRMLKGFLQVALGAESAAAWSRLPDGMEVHRLRCPRGPAQRLPAARGRRGGSRRPPPRGPCPGRRSGSLPAVSPCSWTPQMTICGEHVRHLDAVFDPGSCAVLLAVPLLPRSSCDAPATRAAVLVEIGIRPPDRPALLGLVDGTGTAPPAVDRCVPGRARRGDGDRPARSARGRRRVDPVGLPGTIHVVVVKSDAAALGVHGIAVQRLDGSGTEPWERRIFRAHQRHRDPARGHGAARARDSGGARRRAMGPCTWSCRTRPTADLLVSMADSLAGVELSRLRWQRDLDEGREILTFDGEPATMPEPLSEDARTAVSSPARGGPGASLQAAPAGRRPARRARHARRRRRARRPTPAAWTTWSPGPRPASRWTTASVSDAIADAPAHPRRAAVQHRLGRGPRGRAARPGRSGRTTSGWSPRPWSTASTCSPRGGRRARPLAGLALRDAYRALERTRRWSGGVGWRWRPPTWSASPAPTATGATPRSTCSTPTEAAATSSLPRRRAGRHATEPPTRASASWPSAVVVGVAPLRLEVRSRRLGDGSRIVAPPHAGGAVGRAARRSTLKVQATSFKLGQMPIGRLTADGDGAAGSSGSPACTPALAVGDEVVVADADWFGKRLQVRARARRRATRASTGWPRPRRPATVLLRHRPRGSPVVLPTARRRRGGVDATHRRAARQGRAQPAGVAASRRPGAVRLAPDDDPTEATDPGPSRTA